MRTTGNTIFVDGITVIFHRKFYAERNKCFFKSNFTETGLFFKGVSPNVDFYSGFVYEMLGIPSELYTPLFTIARIAGWSAHRLEELVGCNKIIRPAYKSVMEELE